MSDLGVSLGQSGALHTVTIDGIQYPCKYIDQYAKTAFEKWLFSQNRAAEEIGREYLTAEEYHDRLDKLSKRYLLGEFALMSDLGREALKSRAGMLKLCCILFGVDEMAMLNLMTVAGEEITSLVQVVLKESMRQPKPPKEGEPDPNHQRAASLAG